MSSGSEVTAAQPTGITVQAVSVHDVEPECYSQAVDQMIGNRLKYAIKWKGAYLLNFHDLDPTVLKEFKGDMHQMVRLHSSPLAKAILDHIEQMELYQS